MLSQVQLFVTPWTLAHQAPLYTGLLQAREKWQRTHWSGLPCPPPGDLPNPGIKPQSFLLQVDSLPSELLEKPKNTGVGSLSLLQGIFLTQESNQGFLHFSWILYQLSYQGRPIREVLVSIWRESEIKLFFQLFFVLAAPHSMWDLNSLTGDWTHIPCIGSAES